jgi:hypothetical protein
MTRPCLVVRTNSLRLYGRRSYAMLKNQPTHTILSQCSRRRNYGKDTSQLGEHDAIIQVHTAGGGERVTVLHVQN